MSLQSRKEAFDTLSKRFRCEKPSSLILVHQMKPALWQRLKIAVFLFMSKCLDPHQIILDERELLNAFVKHQQTIKNITPNGLIVPKRHTNLEYNFLVRTFAEIINTLQIEDLIVSWHIPLNLRIKYGPVSEENMKRHHPTEHIHSDSWAGESSESVTTHLPILGDTEKNRVLFYDPPQNFHEDWLKPRPSYQDGAEIAGRYSPINFIPKKGDIVIADFATLHSSSRFADSGPRVSIDTTFVLKKPQSHDQQQERIHPWRENERASHQVLASLGESHLLFFPDDVNQQVDSAGGFKHPTNSKLMELK